MKKIILILLCIPFVLSSCMSPKGGCDGRKENLTLK